MFDKVRNEKTVENDVKLAGASIFIAGMAGVADLTTVNLLVLPAQMRLLAAAGSALIIIMKKTVISPGAEQARHSL